MADKWYEVRVELHHPYKTDDTYTKLHEAMGKAGYARSFTEGGVEYKLPDAVYLKRAAAGQREAFAANVMEIAESVSAKEHPGVVVFEGDDFAHRGLKKVVKPKTVSAAASAKPAQASVKPKANTAPIDVAALMRELLSQPKKK